MDARVKEELLKHMTMEDYEGLSPRYQTYVIKVMEDCINCEYRSKEMIRYIKGILDK